MLTGGSVVPLQPASTRTLRRKTTMRIGRVLILLLLVKQMWVKHGVHPMYHTRDKVNISFPEHRPSQTRWVSDSPTRSEAASGSPRGEAALSATCLLNADVSFQAEPAGTSAQLSDVVARRVGEP